MTPNYNNVNGSWVGHVYDSMYMITQLFIQEGRETHLTATRGRIDSEAQGGTGSEKQKTQWKTSHEIKQGMLRQYKCVFVDFCLVREE